MILCGDELRQDPIFLRSGGTRKGRDGCRVPMPWDSTPPGFGFTDGSPWLPIPDSWAGVSVAAQERDERSMLSLYRAALAARRGSEALRSGSFAWREGPPGSVVFERETAEELVVCAVNVEGDDLELPNGELLLRSDPAGSNPLASGTAAWVRLSR